MARYTGPKCKQCRREQTKLYLKGSKCDTEKCPMNRRQTVPGVHTSQRRRLSGYGVQFREKQKVKRTYGLLEKQFRNTYKRAVSEKGNTGVRVLQLLEMRLDNVVYKLGFVKSRSQARQLVTHGHVTVNGKKLDIPSYTTKVGDIIEVKENSAARDFIQVAAENMKGYEVPIWLEKGKGAKGRVAQAPTRDMIDAGIKEQLIVELYSR